MKRRPQSSRKLGQSLRFESLEKRLYLHGEVVGTEPVADMDHTHTELTEVASESHEHGETHEHTETVAANMVTPPTLNLSAETTRTGTVVSFQLTHFDLSEANVDGPHVDGQGHLHLYVDGIKVGRVYENSYELTDLSAGPHVISADLNSNDHRAYTLHGETIEASVEVNIAVDSTSSTDLPLQSALSQEASSPDVTLGGAESGDTAASSVHSAGDFNGDGIGDVIIGAPNGGTADAGEAYVVYGSQTALPSTFDLSTLNGINGFKLIGVDAGDLAGTSVGGGGDINGDGFDDIVIGAPGVDADSNSNAGAAYVVFGSNSFGATFNLGNLNGENGFRIDGAAAGDDAGRSVAIVSDVNDDGFDDVAIGAPNHDSSAENAGAGYVVYGSANSVASTIDLATLPTAAGIRIDGAEAGENFGYSVETAGDVNGDSVGDIVFGAPTGLGEGVVTSLDPNNTVGLIQSDAAAAPGYTLFSPNPSTDAYLIDENGFVVNTWSASNRPGLSAYLLEDGSLLRTANTGGNNFVAGGNGGAVEIYDWDGNLTWQYSYSTAQYRSHHDVEILPNGNVLMIAWELKSSAEAIAAGRDPALLADGRLWPDHIIEVQPTGATTGDIVWQWNAWDHLVQDFDATKANFGSVADNPQLIDLNFANNGGEDWLHFNSVDYNPALDQILIGVHGFSEIWVIDHSTTTAEAASHTGGDSGKGGDLLYRWGNAQAYDRGTAADRELYAQHDAQWIEPGLPGAGNILLFNNGQQRPGGNASSVDEIAIPVDANGNYALVGNNAYAPNSPTWTWTDSPATDFYAQNISGAQRLANGNTLITNGPIGQFLEVDAAGNKVFEYINPVSNTGPVAQGTEITRNAVFRATKYDPSYAGLAGRDLTPGPTVETGGTTNSSLVVKEGAAYVFFGSSGLANTSVTSLDGSNGFKLTGVDLGDQLGYSVSTAGDLNGDGFSDVIVGSPRAKVDGVSVGAAYVVFGQASGFAAQISAESLNGTNGFRLAGDYESDPVLSSLIVNATGATGYGGAVVNFDSVVPDDNYVHIHTSGIPHYATIGPWGPNPNDATDQDVTFYIPRNPEVNTGTKTATRLGAIGTWVDGTAIFNWSDGQSYQDEGNWNQLAVIFEANGFDACGAHPPRTGQYHTHGAPTCLINELQDDGSAHSPILGWSFDGFPIYGSYGYLNGDPNAGVARIESSWALRNLTTRVDGPTLAEESLGSYREDFEYVSGSGDLDQYNGRFSPTPEYPDGIYHYYVTIDANAEPAFPYAVGVEYNGVVAPGNTNAGGVAPTLDSAEISVGTTGDISGDGVDDAVVGDPDAHVHGVGVAGSVTVVHGHDGVHAADVHLHDVDATTGLHIDGESVGDLTGAAVAGAGDFNGDNGHDLIFGTPGSDSSAGSATLVFGTSVAGLTPTVTSAIRDGGGVLARPDLLSTFAVMFDQDVNIGASDLTIYNETLGGMSADSSSVGFSYDVGTRTATWDFSGALVLNAGSYRFELSDMITAVDGGLALDGDANGSAGGAYTETIYVAIPGDANLDGDVDISQIAIVNGMVQNLGDASILLANLGQTNGQGWQQGDFNADGDVDISQIVVANGTVQNFGDASILLANLGESVAAASTAATAVSTLAANNDHPTQSLGNAADHLPELDVPRKFLTERLTERLGAWESEWHQSVRERLALADPPAALAGSSPNAHQDKDDFFSTSGEAIETSDWIDSLPGVEKWDSAYSLPL